MKTLLMFANQELWVGLITVSILVGAYVALVLFTRKEN